MGSYSVITQMKNIWIYKANNGKHIIPIFFAFLTIAFYTDLAEVGDADPRRQNPGYISEFRFISNQTTELESKIAELHKTMM